MPWGAALGPADTLVTPHDPSGCVLPPPLRTRWGRGVGLPCASGASLGLGCSGDARLPPSSVAPGSQRGGEAGPPGALWGLRPGGH